MMVRNKLFYLALFTLFILFSGNVSGDEPVDKTLEREILETFAEYQDKAISGSKHLARYFSKEANEIWLDWILEEETVEGLLEIYRSVRNSVSFGVEIKDVYEYEIIQGKNGVVVLHLIYKILPMKFAVYEISYVKQSGKWVMSLIHSDTTRPKNYSGHLIENFPRSVLDKPPANNPSE